MAEETKPAPTADRRTVLRGTALGVAVAGVGATAAACSSSNSLPQASNAQTAAAPTTPTTITTTSQVPVGSGFIDGTVSVVVTQPSAGEYKAFTSICTHAGCQVGSVSNNVIQCPCHGSQYSAKDGSVITGPATQPLAAKTITVSGSNIILEP
jgi:Rieske Fe-S protein